MSEAMEEQGLTGPAGKPLNLPWEALVRETAANPAFERGKINVALRAIREAAFSEGLVEEEAIAHEIELRAQAYREKMPNCCLTPTALASHWFRVMVKPLGAPSRQQSAIQAARMRA